MPKRLALRPIGELTAYGVATGTVVGGGIAALLTVPILFVYSVFGFVIVTIPAAAIGQCVGAAVGFIAPAVCTVVVRIVRPPTLRAWRVAVAVTVALCCALPVAVGFVAAALPLSIFSSYPYREFFVIGPSVVVAAVAAWRLAPVLGRAPNDPAPSRRSRMGWWMIALGMLPVFSALAVYGSAWMALNFTFEPRTEDAAVDASLVLPLAEVVTVAAALLAAGIALAWNKKLWQRGEFVVYWAAAVFCTALVSAIGLWRVVAEATT